MDPNSPFKIKAKQKPSEASGIKVLKPGQPLGAGSGGFLGI